ncbi:hypothetical protein [aff. Roholtiella sp. LEGE 12411]|nr:hypothetical protein [aff. Roholtiella sp. LEGE 12411]
MKIALDDYYPQLKNHPHTVFSPVFGQQHLLIAMLPVLSITRLSTDYL